jgi:hypothetical protein
MSGVSVFLSLVLAFVMLGSAAMDFRGAPQIIDLVARMGRLPGFERTLGLIKILGALGLRDSTAETAPAIGLFAVSALTLLTRFFG